MSKPPIKALQAIRNYCLKTQCRQCVFADRIDEDRFDYVGCMLQEDNPCDWELEEVQE